MADPELSLGGLPLLYDLNQQAGDFLRMYQPLTDLIVQARAIQTNNSKDSTVGSALIGLAKPNYPDPPTPRLNQLYWPTGASRWARGYFLASKTVAQSLSALGNHPFAFKAVVHDITVETDLYILPPHPVSCVVGEETLWMIPVVDVRYWWQFMNIGSFGKPDLTSWSALFSQISSRLGVTIEVDTIPDAYLSPDPDEFTRRFDNIATLLDAAAHSVGLRIVRQFDGTVSAVSWESSLLEHTYNLEYRTPWWQIAGDEFDNTSIPGGVTVAFPVTNCGVPSCNRLFHSHTISSSNSHVAVSGTVKTFHSTAWANRDEDDTVTNDVELLALATAVAEDYYGYLSTAYDYTFAGIKDWFLTGYDDHILFTFGAEDPEPKICATTDVFKAGPDDFDGETAVSREFQRLCTTRIQSAPHNFGVDQLLQQGETAAVPVGLLAFEVAEGASPGSNILQPGGTVAAQRLEESLLGWVYAEDCEQTLADPFYRNFLVPGERVWARRNCTTGNFDIVGENGLKRTAVVSATSIHGGGSGNVILFSGDPFESASCTRASTGLVVSACHLPGADTVNQGDVVKVDFHPDQRKWIIVGGGGGGSTSSASQLIAIGRLYENVCPADHTTVFSDVIDVALINGTMLDPSTVSARFRWGCRGEAGDLALLLRVIDPGDEESTQSSSSSSGGCCDLVINIDMGWGLLDEPDSIDRIEGQFPLTYDADTEVYSGSGVTTNGDPFTVSMSVSDGMAHITVSVSSTPLVIMLGSVEAWTDPCEEWESEFVDVAITRSPEPIIADEFAAIGSITLQLLNCETVFWDVIFVEHKKISPIVRIYETANTVRAVKRDCAVMYCSPEYEETLWETDDECPT